jgi:hypothetical protein
MQLGSLKDSFPCFARLNPCIAHCSTDSIPWVHHSREEGSLDYDGGFVRLQIHMKFDTNIHHQHICMCTYVNNDSRMYTSKSWYALALKSMQ